MTTGIVVARADSTIKTSVPGDHIDLASDDAACGAIVAVSTGEPLTGSGVASSTGPSTGASSTGAGAIRGIVVGTMEPGVSLLPPQQIRASPALFLFTILKDTIIWLLLIETLGTINS